MLPPMPSHPHASIARAAGWMAGWLTLMVVIAERDSIVPVQFGIALYESGQGLRRLVTIKHAEHNDWADQVDVAWWHHALAFLLPPKQ